MSNPAPDPGSGSIEKVTSGVRGLDEITEGGFPKGGITVVAGNAGCGKTVFGLHFLARGAFVENEPGVFVALEEKPEALIANFRTFGFDLRDAVNQGLIRFVRVSLEDTPLVPEGRYDIGSCFIKLSEAIASMNARRVVIDSLDSLYTGVESIGLLRTQISGMFSWLRSRNVTVLVTAEAGTQTLTRRGIEDYLADCVIKLDYRVADQLSTRRLRVVKYRGSSHPSDEFPFLIDEQGITVVPITSTRLEYVPSGERISTGIEGVDAMLGGSGFFRGSSILLSGTPGSGKTTVAFAFLDSACRRGEKAAYFGFEESPGQIARDMRSVGLDIEQWRRKGLLRIYSSRASMRGLESHLVSIYRAFGEFTPDVVVIDPMTSLADVGTVQQAKSVLTRLIDFLKARATTALFIDLVHGDSMNVSTKEEVSSLIDTWLLLRDKEENNQTHRTLMVLKSRGMAHSTEICDFDMTDHGIIVSRGEIDRRWRDKPPAVAGGPTAEVERRKQERRKRERRGRPANVAG